MLGFTHARAGHDHSGHLLTLLSSQGAGATNAIFEDEEEDEAYQPDDLGQEEEQEDEEEDAFADAAPEAAAEPAAADTPAAAPPGPQDIKAKLAALVQKRRAEAVSAMAAAVPELATAQHPDAP